MDYYTKNGALYFSLLLLILLGQVGVSAPCTCGIDTASVKPTPTPATASCCSAEPAAASANQSSCGCGSPSESLKPTKTMQSDKDCGVWSLAYIAKSLGIKKDEKAIKKLISYDQNKGATMQELAQGAQKLGLEAKGYRMSYTELSKRKLPLIVYIPNHFMVLMTIDTRKNLLMFADATKKKIEMSKDEFLNLWQGYVLEVKKKP